MSVGGDADRPREQRGTGLASAAGIVAGIGFSRLLNALFDAAGFDPVLIETLGVGQDEIDVTLETGKLAPGQSVTCSFDVTQASDIYSIGVILYEALTGTKPFTGTMQEILAKAQNTEPLWPRKVVSSVPRDLELICLKCLQKPPELRYSSAADLATIGAEVLDDPYLAQIVRTTEATIPTPGGSATFENRNLLLETYEGAIGIKTGRTLGAGNVLVAGNVVGDRQRLGHRGQAHLGDAFSVRPAQMRHQDHLGALAGVGLHRRALHVERPVRGQRLQGQRLGLTAFPAAAFSLIWTEDLAAHREKVERVTRDGGEYHSEFRVTRPLDGRVIWMEERATALIRTGVVRNALVLGLGQRPLSARVFPSEGVPVEDGDRRVEGVFGVEPPRLRRGSYS